MPCRNRTWFRYPTASRFDVGVAGVELFSDSHSVKEVEERKWEREILSVRKSLRSHPILAELASNRPWLASSPGVPIFDGPLIRLLYMLLDVKNWVGVIMPNDAFGERSKPMTVICRL